MILYKIGQIVDSFVGHQEGVYFDIADDGATMLVFFHNPAKEEIEQFESGVNFEIRFTELNDVIMLTVKIGSLNWMDAPYTPHLSKHLTSFYLPDKDQGLGLTLILIDASTGEIKHIRLIGLSVKFTKELLKITAEHISKTFDMAVYNNSLNKIFSTYDTKQIVKMSSSYCKVH